MVSRGARGAGDEQREQDRERGDRAEAVREGGHGGSVAEVCVTAQARGVPDV